MFSALRESSTFYVLYKGEKPKLQIGQVQSVSQPMTKFGTVPAIGQYGIDTVVDVKVKIKDDIVEFKQLPSNMEIANFGSNSIIVSESRTAMLSEIESMIKNSQSVLDSIDYHKTVLSVCEEIQKELSPELKREKEREDKILSLEDSISQLKEMVSKALEHIKT